MQSNRIGTLVLWIVVVFVMGSVTGPTPAAAIHVPFLDDFSDMDFSDETPVTWLPAGPLLLDASTGDLVLTSGSSTDRRAIASLGGVTVDGVGNLSVHTQLRLLQGEQGSENRNSVRVGVFDSAFVYTAGIKPDGTITLRSFDIALGGPGGGVDLASTLTALDMFSSDIHLRLNVLGDALSLSAWADGTLEPLVPQLTVTGLTPLTGDGVSVQGQRTLGPSSIAAFRFVEVSLIPEPSTGLLVGLGLVVGLAVKRKDDESCAAVGD